MSIDDELQHPNPAWKEKADFLIRAQVVDKIWSKQFSYEQLTVKKLDDEKYEICCIPFALYDVCLGDIVIVDGKLNLSSTIKVSDHLGFRIATLNKEMQDKILDEIGDFNPKIEKYSDKLVAIDVENSIDGKNLANVLQAAEDSSAIRQYETIRTA